MQGLGRGLRESVLGEDLCTGIVSFSPYLYVSMYGAVQANA